MRNLSIELLQIWILPDGSGQEKEMISNPQAGVRTVHHGTGKAAQGSFGIRRSDLGQPGGVCDRGQGQNDGVHADWWNRDDVQRQYFFRIKDIKRQ